MKYNKTKLITYTNKKITNDSWNQEDESIYNAYNLLMYALKNRLERKNEKAIEKAGNPFIDLEVANHETLLKYFAVLINDTLEKVEIDKSKWSLDYINQDREEDYIHNYISQLNTVIYELDQKGTVLTEEAIARNKAIAKARREHEEKQLMLQKAKALAKAELLQEQEYLRFMQEEAEEESNQIVIPLKNYGK